MKTKIFLNIFLSLSAIFALAITAHAQNLYVTLNFGAIYEYTPSGVQSIYDSGQMPPGLNFPRGLAFDSIGNLFVAETVYPDLRGVGPLVAQGIGRVLKFDLNNKVSTFGTIRVPGEDIFLIGLATDIAGNVYVLATVNNDPTVPGTIFEFTPSGEGIVFGSVPGIPNNTSGNFGLAFDSAGNLYATATGAQTIYKFAPNRTRTVFVGPSAFTTGVYPIGLAFDSSGNLFVSTNCFAPDVCAPGSDTILKFTPGGVESTFATGLTNPRGLAVDSSGNLFVAETNPFPDGDILEFAPGDGTPTAFASSLRRPQFLTFGPPRLPSGL